MAWISLFVVRLLGVLWAFTMKQWAGLTKLGPSVVTPVASVVLLSHSM